MKYNNLNQKKATPSPVENDKFNGNYGYFTDLRDQNKYRWVRIGSEIWMAENLRYKHPEGIVPSNNSEKDINEYGLLYSYKAALKSCPENWRLPLPTDYEVLFKYFGKDIKEQIKNMLKTSKQAFNLKPAGSKDLNRSFTGLDSDACLWASTENSCKSVTYLQISPETNCICKNYSIDPDLKQKVACSVRCILRSEKEEETLIRDYMLNRYKINREYYSDIENAVSVLVNIAKKQGFIATKNNGYFTLNKENIEAKRIGKVLVELAMEGVYTKGSIISININILLGFVINKVESYLPDEQHGQLKYLWRNTEGFN